MSSMHGWGTCDVQFEQPDLCSSPPLGPCHQARVSTPMALPYYHGLLPYLEYCLYPPLYIAGPIMSYNSFASQRASPLGLTWRQVGSAAAYARGPAMNHHHHHHCTSLSYTAPKFLPAGPLLADLA